MERGTNNIMSELLALSAEDRQKVRALLVQADGDDAVISGEADDAVKRVWPIFTDLLKDKGIMFPHVGIVSRHRAYPRLVVGCQHLLKFCDQFKPKGELERSAAARFCAKALIAYIEKRVPAAISPKVIADQLPRVGIAIDRQFPGYRASNLLRVLIRPRGTTLARAGR